jgi:hypothetical protein
MKHITNTNLKMLTVLAALALSTASLVIPMQESRAQDGKNAPIHGKMMQENKCKNDTNCINIICVASETCIIPELNFPFKLPF